MKSASSKLKQPRSKSVKPDPKKLNQATSAEFEREGMGIAPKE
jgi:hypothetical protein